MKYLAYKNIFFTSYVRFKLANYSKFIVANSKEGIRYYDRAFNRKKLKVIYMSIKRLDKEDYVFLPEFRDHDEVIKIEDSEVGLLGFVGIHKKLSGIPALGATRLWKYKTEEEALRDALNN